MHQGRGTMKMSKRAVRMDYELLREFIVEGAVFGSTECIEGIPEDATFVGIFLSLLPILILVVDSDSWDNEPSEHTVECLGHGSVPIQEVLFKRAC